jgi:rhodanese-related sulfurtransferase
VPITQIPPAEFGQWVKTHRNAGASPVLLDVREPWETRLSSVSPEGVILEQIPMQQVPASLSRLGLKEPIAVLCHHGVRSMHVAHFLWQQGFENVANVTGGIHAWSLQADPEIPLY